MCTSGPSMAPGFVSNVYACILVTVHKQPLKCVLTLVAFRVRHHQQYPQNFCQEAVMWKRLTHRNILPLLGITTSPFQLISSWMAGGDLPEYIRKNPGVNRFGLVRVPPRCVNSMLTPVASYLALLKVSVTSTPAMWFMGT